MASVPEAAGQQEEVSWGSRSVVIVVAACWSMLRLATLREQLTTKILLLKEEDQDISGAPPHAARLPCCFCAVLILHFEESKRLAAFACPGKLAIAILILLLEEEDLSS